MEVIRWISIVFMWAAVAMNLWAFFRCNKAYKQTRKAMAKANEIIFKDIRQNSKRVILVNGDKLCDHCQNGGDGCSVAAGVNCTRFLPTEGTNLTDINGVVETPPEVTTDEFSNLLMDWLDSKGWRCTAIVKPYVEDQDGRNN